MINRLLIFILLIVLGCSSKQNSKEVSRETVQLDSLTPDSFKKLFLPTFDWEAIEIKTSDDEKRKLIRQNSPWIRDENINERYLAGVHVVDFNGDGVNDFIYSGPGPATLMTIISVDTAGFSDFSNISSMDIINGKVRRLYLQSVISTGGPAIEGYTIIDIIYSDNSPRFVRRIDCEEIAGITFPKEYSNFEVESISDTIIGRSEPIELDTPYQWVLELPGNQLGKITKGTKAIVAAQTKDSLNNDWFFTLISPGFKIHGYTYLNGTFNPDDKMYRMVWSKGEGWKKVN